jgi:hypothetical protein
MLFIIAMVLAIYGGVLSGIIAAVVLSGSLTERFLGRAVIIQSGLICWMCGYNLGSHTISTCPECGVAFDHRLPPRSASYDFLAFLKLRRRWPLVLGVLIALVPLGYSTTTQTIPAIRFLKSCPATAELRRVTNVNYIFLPASGGGVSTPTRPLSNGWWIPDPLDPNSGFGVVFYPVAIPGKPRMFITRGCLQDTGAAVGIPTDRNAWSVYPGTENVVAKLTAAQADEVIRTQTVPDGLIAALRAKAHEVHWAVQSSATKWPSGEHPVDPAPFFANTP